MPEAYTSRGFADYATFTDTYGAKVVVRQSSAATVDRVWIFVDHPSRSDDGTWKAAAHLSTAQARVVVAALQEWLETAEDDPEDEDD